MSNKSFGIHRLSVVGATCAAVAMGGLTAPRAAAQEEQAGLEEIIVTARKREENLQYTPMSITALTADDLARRDISNINRIDEVTPNLIFDTVSPSSGQTNSVMVSIRGVGQLDFTGTTEPGVGIYVDGVYYARSISSAIEFLDIDRVEVLRGPQGTLFGRNTIGGAINVVTKQPADEFGGYVELVVGTDSRTDATLNVDFPMSDTFKGKFTVATRQQDGYVINQATGVDYGDRDTQSARLVLQWEPTDTLMFSLNTDYTTQRENSAPNSLTTANPTSAFAGFHNFAGPGAGVNCVPPDPTGNPTCYSSDWIVGPEADWSGLSSQSDLDNWGVSLTADWQGASVTLKSITAYRDLDSFSSRDGDHSPLVIFQTTDLFDYDQFSQEFQLSGQSGDERLNWLAGLYYFEEQGINTNPVFISVGTLRSGGSWDHDTSALFGQLSYDFTDKLNLTVGARFTDETKRYTPDNVYETPLGFAPGTIAGIDPAIWATYPASITVPVEAAQAMFGLPPNVAPSFGMTQAVGVDFFVLPNTQVTQDIEETSPMVSLSYQLNDDVMFYGSYGEAFKGGGFTQRVAQIRLATPQFQPEFVKSFEIGIKTLLLDNRLRLNAAAFHNDYEDIQIFVRQAIAPVTVNAGDGTITGVEIDFDYLPVDAFRLTGGIGLLDAEYDSLLPEAIANGISLDNQLTKAPEINANISGIYTHDLGSGGSLSARINYSYTDDMFHDPQNHPELFWGSYSLLGAAINYESANQRWLVTLGGTNLTDEQYMSSGSWSLATGGYAEGVFDRGRQYYATARFGF